MTLLAMLRRRTEETTVTDTATTTDKTANDVLMRFLTQGGATVELYSTRFVTRWRGGPPFAAATPYEINGFQWKCAGCGAYGREGETYDDPNYRTEKEAREAANGHAGACWSMPKTTA